MEDVRHLLTTLRGRYNQTEMAQALGITTRTLRRWEIGETDPPPYAADAIRQRLLPLADHTQDGDGGFRFIDLFAGIGGIRMAFEHHGGRCVFTSEWNPWAQKTYLANFPESMHTLEGDITKVDAADIPDHDVLLAGFPCQPFSIAGVSKKNALGRAHGFADETQGTLFFDVARIIAAKRPAAFLLENVKNLVSHDKGNTFRVIKKVLEEELNYHITCKVVDGAHFVPQHRERILIVGFREKTDFSFDDLVLPSHKPTMKEILHPQDGSEVPEAHYTVGAKAKVDDRYTLTPKLWAYLQAYAQKHRAAGNGFGFGLVGPDSVSRTLSARYYKDGSEILVSQGPRKRPRRLTPRECARLMGFPDDFVIPVSDTQAYKQFADAAVVPMIDAVAKCMVEKLPSSDQPVNEITLPSPNAFTASVKWSREQTLLAFKFYCETPFGQLHGRNKKIIELAGLIGRTPDALAMKCVNLASLDPKIRDSGRAGLSNASALDRQIWEEAHANWDETISECGALLEYLHKGRVINESEVLPDDERDFTGEVRAALVKQRVKQAFFRRTVLSSYGERCCISGVSDKRFLIASHIVPWNEDVAIRLHPGNGLCLSAIHDKAFDKHLFSLTDDHHIILSAQLKNSQDEFLRQVFWPTEDKRISLPEKFAPEPSFITRHREKMVESTGRP